MDGVLHSTFLRETVRLGLEVRFNPYSVILSIVYNNINNFEFLDYMYVLIY